MAWIDHVTAGGPGVAVRANASETVYLVKACRAKQTWIGSAFVNVVLAVHTGESCFTKALVGLLIVETVQKLFKRLIRFIDLILQNFTQIISHLVLNARRRTAVVNWYIAGGPGEAN